MDTPSADADAESPRDGASRRDFLSGKLVGAAAREQGERLADELAESRKSARASGQTLRLATRAMNCEFSIILNPRPRSNQLTHASDILEQVHAVESLLTVYRDDSPLQQLNRSALKFTPVESELFDVLTTALDIAEQTAGAFNPFALSLNRLWREARQRREIPAESAIAAAVAESDWRSISRNPDTRTFRFSAGGFDLGGMGKGYALDRLSAALLAAGVSDFLMHGGQSSMLARGQHLQTGWPVGIRDPRFPQKRIATLILIDQAFSASGSGVQFFRHQGRRYGHLIDPRTGWPVDHVQSVIVTAPTAALADAFSTAFSVFSIDQTQEFCERHTELGVILFPTPAPGKSMQPLVCNLTDDVLHWEP